MRRRVDGAVPPLDLTDFDLWCASHGLAVGDVAGRWAAYPFWIDVRINWARRCGWPGGAQEAAQPCPSQMPDAPWDQSAI